MSFIPFVGNAAQGIKRWLDYDNGELTIVTQQDASDLIEQNKREMSHSEGHWRGDIHKVGSIPLTVYYDLIKRGLVSADGNVIDHDEVQREMTRFLNDSDNRLFRTKHGVI